ncbi:MAG TPA: class I SAM-dependent methyltransferase, partial [Thermomicrobiales bacterium]
GFDVIPELVAWCQQEITPRYPQFRFQVADVYNGEYHPPGAAAAARYRFPYADASFDFVLLVSVFTHMLPDDVYHYLAEIARVLKPGGTVYASYYLLDDESRSAILRGEARLAFTDAKDGYATLPDLSQEYALALCDSTVRLTHEKVGLRIRATQLGLWRQNINQWAGQDVLIAERL